MLAERVGMILGQDIGVPDAGIEHVAQHKINDLVFSAKGDRGLRPADRDGAESLALAAREDHGDGVPGDVGACIHDGYPPR